MGVPVPFVNSPGGDGEARPQSEIPCAGFSLVVGLFHRWSHRPCRREFRRRGNPPKRGSHQRLPTRSGAVLRRQAQESVAPGRAPKGSDGFFSREGKTSAKLSPSSHATILGSRGHVSSLMEAFKVEISLIDEDPSDLLAILEFPLAPDNRSWAHPSECEGGGSVGGGGSSSPIRYSRILA